MALDLSRAGMATHSIQEAGRSDSPAMVVRYTRSGSAGRGAAVAGCEQFRPHEPPARKGDHGCSPN